MNNLTLSIRPALALLAGSILMLSACNSETADFTADDQSSETSAPQASETTGTANGDVPKVTIVVGLDGLIEHLKQEDWWGEVNPEEQLTVPHMMITRIHPSWREVAPNLPVQQKKAVFYRLMLPLVMHANEMVMDRREELLQAQASLAAGKAITSEEIEQLQRAAVLLRVMSEEEAAGLTADSPDLAKILDEMLYRLDVIPPGLALGQAAYESGYGTSRFAADGNALFGQWIYGGNGMQPEEKRASKGNYGVAAFEWPFDSVRGYFINLMSHPAYEDFRRLRADLRAAGEPLSSLRLADGLVRYSERGQEYVDGLKGIIRVNKLEVADTAVFRAEPLRFIISEGSQEEADALEQRIADARASGELAEIYARMRLE
jgi:uncharacterized FlgJ-related protein